MKFREISTFLKVSALNQKGAKSQNLADWALNTPIIMDNGQPFSFFEHEYLKTPYEDTHLNVVEEKAAQMGLSTKAMLICIHKAIFEKLNGILYLFPNRTDVTDFSRGRIDPLVQNNPSNIGQWMKDTNSANLKKIGDCFLYLRGMQSKVGLKSVPASFMVFDELDEAPQDNVKLALERMSHSQNRTETWLKLSNPTLPDYGIDKAFSESDQRYWLVKCHKCNEYTCLEDTFPACLVEHDGRVYRACQKCGGELDPSYGEWVAKKPDVTEVRGYHYSQLFSKFVDPAKILREFQTSQSMSTFYNMKLGMAYIEAENRLSVEEVLALCGNMGVESSDVGPCYMGVDQGNLLHVTIAKRHWEKSGQIIHIGIYKDWYELDSLMKNFRVSRCVVDALPEKRNAQAFGERFPGKVYLNFYQDHQRGRYAWDDSKMVVTCNRTESLDSSHMEIMHKGIILPKVCDVVKEFAKQLHNVGKKIEEDDKTGSKRYVYVKLGPDHFRHSWNYANMALQFARESFFGDSDLS